ncbi:hypothetical protein Defa_17700 [Desulfovibrio sp. TH_2024_36128]|uniref:Uncharacterized protein n=1 Tax=Desulfovibrio falkowii TaxID=3136602 RepID=A0ABQ0E982_9BACT
MFCVFCFGRGVFCGSFSPGRMGEVCFGNISLGGDVFQEKGSWSLPEDAQATCAVPAAGGCL